MANKYTNLIGSNKIKNEYIKINDGFDKVETDINATNSRINNIVNNPDPNKDLEVVDARQSTIKDKTFATLGARIEENESDLNSHKAERMPHQLTDTDTSKNYKYGLKIVNNYLAFMIEEV